MSEISIRLGDPDESGPAPERKPRRKRKPPRERRPASGEELERKNRRTLVGSVLFVTVVVHAVILMLFGAWTVAQHFRRPEARFEVHKSVRIPPRTPEHKMNVAKHEAMTPKPTFNDRLVSTRPVEFALPELPQVDMEQMLPLDPSELISDQVAGLAGSAALGAGLGHGLAGAGGTGEGMSFFGIQAAGDRILLLFDVSTSVVNKATAAGVPLERIQEETVRLIESLPISSQFSLIQFTRNYMPFTEELIAATPGNKRQAREWVEEKWVTAGTMSSARAEVVRNPEGLVGVLERAAAMRPDVVFILSDAGFWWQPEGAAGSNTIPYDELESAVAALEREGGGRVAVHVVAFQPRPDDARQWGRLTRRTGGEFRELKEGR